MTKASDNAFPSILITEGTEPSAPAAGKQRLYIDSTTHIVKATNSSGVERSIEGGNELDYAQVTSTVSPTATTEATANTVVAGNAVTYDGSTVVMIEFYCPNASPAQAADATMILWLYDGASSIGAMGGTQQPVVSHAASFPVHAMRRLTPSNASHTYTIKASVSTGTGTLQAGAGGAGVYPPMYIRITRA